MHATLPSAWWNICLVCCTPNEIRNANVTHSHHPIPQHNRYVISTDPPRQIQNELSLPCALIKPTAHTQLTIVSRNICAPSADIRAPHTDLGHPFMNTGDHCAIKCDPFTSPRDPFTHARNSSQEMSPLFTDPVFSRTFAIVSIVK